MQIKKPVMKKYKVVDASRPIFYEMRKLGAEIELPEDVGNGWVATGLIVPLVSESAEKVVANVSIDDAIAALNQSIASTEAELEKAKSENKPQKTITQITNRLNKAKADLAVLQDDKPESAEGGSE
jgi:hypothetical protein